MSIERIDVEHWKQVVKDSTPGKFEGEKPETAYFYDAMMDGNGEIIETGEEYLTYFELTENEKEAFKLDGPYFVIECFGNGFITGYEINQARLDYFVEKEEGYINGPND